MEIKFRGKRIDNGEWVYGYYFITPLTEEKCNVSDAKAGIFFLSDGRKRHCISDEGGSVWEIDPGTIGQYVGMHDKTRWEDLTETERLNFVNKGKWKGREYYHGDIFRLDSWDPEIFEIVYDRGGFCFRHSKDDAYYSDIKYAEDGVKIGNIHDNPELLNQ